MNKGKILFLICFSLLLVSGLKAQDADKYFVDVELSNSTPLKTEEVVISYKLRYKGNSISLTNPRYQITPIDVGEHFRVVRKGQKRGMDFDMSGSITVFEYQFILQPLKAGAFTINPVTVNFNGTNYESKAVTLKVLASSAPSQISQADKIFIDARISKADPWKGEEFYLTYKLYSKYELYNITELLPPTIDGFSASVLDIDDNSRSKVEKINGEQYYTMKLYQAQLYPLREGEFYIDPYQASITAKVPTGRKVRDFWGTRPELKLQSVPLKSQKLRIKVRDLPAAGRPDDFHGAVGEFNLNTSLDQTATETGEPLTLKITVGGKGNLKLLAEPKLDLPPGFEAYEPRIKSAGSSRSYEYLLIPNKPGEFTLQPYSFSYFDTRKERYVSLESPVYEVVVSQGEMLAGNSGGSSGMSKEEVARLADDIRFLQPGIPAFGQSQKPFFGSGLFYTGLAAPFLLAIPLFIMGRRRRQISGDVALSKNRKARKLAVKRFKKAKKFVAENDKSSFYNELVRAIWGYLTDKFGIDPGNLSRENIKNVLAEKHIPSEYVDEIIGLLDRGEMALFAPASEGSLEADYQAAVGLLEKVEGELARR